MSIAVPPGGLDHQECGSTSFNSNWPWRPDPTEARNDGGPPGKSPPGAGLNFAAYNNHDPRCGPPPRLRNTAAPGLYHGYFDNRYREQFVLAFP
jgi:hypothetical protein